MSSPSRTHSEAELAPQRSNLLELWVALALIAVWVALLSRFGKGNVYAVMGPYACVVTGVCLLLSPRELLGAFACSARDALLGVGVGALMTLLTYPAYDLAARLIPNLKAEVAGLYVGAHSTSLAKALLWVGALVIAEEALFRGVLPRALRLLLGPRAVWPAAALAYALAQLGSGSFIIFLLALVCGTIWVALRWHTRSLTPSLIAHGIWTPTLILLFPVT